MLSWRVLTSYTVPRSASYGIDWAYFLHQITDLLSPNLEDPGMKSWILLGFSASTEEDTTVASIIVMATFQYDFGYSCNMEMAVFHPSLC